MIVKTFPIPASPQATMSCALGTLIALGGISPWQRGLEGVGTVNHPVFMPRKWREGRRLVESAISYATTEGWSLVRPDDHDGVLNRYGLSARTYLIPPEPILAQLLMRPYYDLLKETGILRSKATDHILLEFAHSVMAPFSQLRQLVEALSINWPGTKMNSDETEEVLKRGGILIHEGSRRYLLGCMELEETGLTTDELDLFARYGLISYRRAEGPPVERKKTGLKVSKAPVMSSLLDLPAFAQTNRARWSSQKLQSVVSISDINDGLIGGYKELSGWLLRHIDLIEDNDLSYINSQLHRIIKKRSQRTQRQIARLIAGRLAEIAFRKELHADYRSLSSRHDDAVLLLEHQFRDAEGKPASDALLGRLIIGTGTPSMEIHAIYEIGLGGWDSASRDAQLLWALDDRYAAGIHIRGAERNGLTIAASITDPSRVALKNRTLERAEEEEIHDIALNVARSAATNFGSPEWHSPSQEGGARQPQDETIARPGKPLYALELGDLDRWVNISGSNILHLTGHVLSDTTTIGLAVHSKAPPVMSKYFRVEVEKGEDDKWSVKWVEGGSIDDVLTQLRSIKGLKVPTDERIEYLIKKTHNQPLSRFQDMDRWPEMTIADLENWSEEWNSDRIVLTGRVTTDDRTVGKMGVDSKLPPVLKVDHFAITIVKYPVVGWKVEDLMGIKLEMPIKCLRSVKGFLVPTDEWLTHLLSKRESCINLSRFRKAGSWKDLGGEVLDKWSEEWKSPVIVLSGSTKTDGTIKGFEVSDRPVAHGNDDFVVVFEKDDSDHWHLRSIGGSSLKELLGNLRQSGSVTMPSNEWLSRDRQKSLTKFTTVDSLKDMTTDVLDGWAGEREWNTKKLRVMFYVLKNKDIICFAINSDVHGNHLTLTEFEKIDDKWHLTALDGGHSDDVLKVLSGVKGLHIPSNEWLYRDKIAQQTTLKRVASVDELVDIVGANSNTWAKEWKTDQLIMRGRISANGKVDRFGVGTEVPDEGGVFVVTVKRASDEAWKIVDAKGVGFRYALPAFRRIKNIAVPSNERIEELLNRDSMKPQQNLNRFRSLGEWKNITPTVLDQWAEDWGTTELVMTGRIKVTKGSMSGFRIGDSSTNCPGHNFIVRWQRSAEGEWRFSLAGPAGPYAGKYLEGIGFRAI